MNVSKRATHGLLYTQTGTPYYASPEVWQNMPYNLKSDIWSLGCVLYEAAALHPPFKAKDMEGLFLKVISGIVPSLPKYYSSNYSEFIKRLMQQDPHKRPTCSTPLPYS